MLCEVCKKKVQTKLNIINIFETEKHHLCEHCFQQYPIIPKYQMIPIESGKIDHYFMIPKYRKITPRAYMSFLKIYYLDFLRHHVNSTFLYFDEFNDQVYELLDSMRHGDIYLVTLYDNIKKKEKNYEIRSRR